MEWYLPGALGDARIAQSAIFVCMSRANTNHSSELPMHTLTPVSTTPPSSPQPPSQRQSGFTLVELLLATVVLAVGLLALTSAGVAIVRLETRGQQLAGVAAAAETRLELLRTRGCAATSGVSRSGRLEERWSVMQTLPRTLLVMDTVSLEASGDVALPRVYTFRSSVRC